MSSLRISHQNRGIGVSSAGSDTGRSEHADEGASFAVALGAASGVAPKNAVALLGGKSGDGGDSSSGPRKRTETPAKPGDPAAIAASVAGALIAAPVAIEPAASADAGEVVAVAGRGGTVTITDSGGTAATRSPTTSADMLAAPHSAPGAPRGAIQTVVSKIAFVGSQEVLAAPPGSVTAAPVATGSIPASPDVTTTGPARAHGVSSIPALLSAGTSTPQTAPGKDGDAPPTGAGADASQTGASVVVTPGVSVSHAAPLVQASALSAGAATTATPSAATVGVAADASGLAGPPAVTLPVGPGPGTSHIANAAAASPVLPSLTAGQPVTADGGAASGFAPRDRFIPVAAEPDASSVAAASANAAAVNASVPAAASAASATGLTSDASSTNTVADQVAGQLARMVSNGSSEMVMRLHPPELGDLTVRVAVSGRDVAAWFASPQPQVQSAISAAIGQLQANLGNAGYTLNGAWVGADASSARQQQDSSLPTSPAPRAPLAAVTALPAATASVRSPSSGLNVYV